MSARRPILAALACCALALAGSAAAAAAPLVQGMVVGARGEALVPARNLGAVATSVRVGRRSCAVAAGTPLAVLAAMRRAGGPAFTLRDYGRCGPAPVNSGQLFVNSIAGQVNRGQDGWEYKVAGRSGTTGAADPSGPMGDGRRLRSGVQVLWFWCHSAGGGCQRALEVTVPARAARGGAVPVRVLGRDNEGRAVPVAGAVVRLGSDFASTAADGSATLLAPGIGGRVQVTAARAGLVPSFPQAVTVE
ncbi:MAG TPA: hypothetical protein VII01_09620 [Solirubrobacteraceae bacterium]